MDPGARFGPNSARLPALSCWFSVQKAKQLHPDQDIEIRRIILCFFSVFKNDWIKKNPRKPTRYQYTQTVLVYYAGFVCLQVYCAGYAPEKARCDLVEVSTNTHVFCYSIFGLLPQDFMKKHSEVLPRLVLSVFTIN